jgi:hypothetical protein
VTATSNGVAHGSTDYDAEAERLYRDLTKLATNEYELADIEAALLYETEASGDN